MHVPRAPWPNAAEPVQSMANTRIPKLPAHPERICWGCSRYCAADDLRCGNGKERTQHPVETFGPDWTDFLLERAPDDPTPSG